jgi:hypothetical protein
MQNVDFRDGKLRFRLPKRWTAEYLQDGAIFREPEGIGVLFLSTLEVEAPDGADDTHALDFLANHAGHEGREILQLKNGNSLVTYVEHNSEMAAFAWEVAHAIPPDKISLAAFTFTVRVEASQEKKVVEIVTMLTQEIASASFGKS